MLATKKGKGERRQQGVTAPGKTRQNETPPCECHNTASRTRCKRTKQIKPNAGETEAEAEARILFHMKVWLAAPAIDIDINSKKKHKRLRDTEIEAMAAPEDVLEFYANEIIMNPETYTDLGDVVEKLEDADAEDCELDAESFD